MIDFIKANLPSVIAISVVVLLICVALIAVCVLNKKGKNKPDEHKTEEPVDTHVEQETPVTTEEQKAEEEENTSETIEEKATEEDKSEEVVNSDEQNYNPEKDLATENEAVHGNNVISENEKSEEGEVKMEEKVSTKYAGKWYIYQKAEKEFIAVLKASNGEVVLTSESYSSAKSVETGIETIKKSVANNNFQIYTDKKGYFFYKLKDQANRLLCIGEVYATKKRCESSVESVKKFSETAILQPDIVDDETLIEYKPQENEVLEDVANIKDQYRGKWEISVDDANLYTATLYASNGQILLNSEKYKTPKYAKQAIDNYKENIKNNNFIIDIDKTGKYYYKLRNAQKLTLAVGETYNELKACINAIESVRKFARIAKDAVFTNDDEA